MALFVSSDKRGVPNTIFECQKLKHKLGDIIRSLQTDKDRYSKKHLKYSDTGSTRRWRQKGKQLPTQLESPKSLGRRSQIRQRQLREVATGGLPGRAVGAKVKRHKPFLDSPEKAGQAPKLCLLFGNISACRVHGLREQLGGRGISGEPRPDARSPDSQLSAQPTHSTLRGWRKVLRH